jgi:hypothetical protein
MNIEFALLYIFLENDGSLKSKFNCTYIFAINLIILYDSWTGKCICHQYYHGAICDIDERIPPIVTDIEGGGICDTGKGEDCRCFYLRGDNFLESIKCKTVTSVVSKILLIKDLRSLMYCLAFFCRK